MIGLIVQHQVYGYGKVITLAQSGARVRFCGSDQILDFGLRAFQEKVLKHARLLVETPARGPHGLCVISSVPDPGQSIDSVFTYGVVYEGGLTARVSELELLPLVAVDQATVIGQLASYGAQAIAKVVAREKFVESISLLNRQAGGIRALLASRIDLHPHQAYVAGTVILDPQRRYILADEVGLGKTIEAGVIIHDRLMQQPSARILILTPGALTRQWLCELHSSFGGQDFRLLDLHPVDVVLVSKWRRVICSTTLAFQSLANCLESQHWDIVVVDEVHHLLSTPLMYDLVARLSEKAPDLLLLSALPARSREQEFLKLLRLLEPRRYREGTPTAERFSELYAAQAIISRRINRLANEIRDHRSGDATPSDIIEMIDNVMSLPVVSEDSELQQAAASAREAPSLAAEHGEWICAEVIDRYRIHRRILRNRRALLIDAELLQPVRRTVTLVTYEPSQLEGEAHALCQGLLRTAKTNGCPPDILRPLARTILGSLSAPAFLVKILAALDRANVHSLPERALEFINFAGSVNYESWNLTEDLICSGARRFIPTNLLKEALSAAALWGELESPSRRMYALCRLLDDKRAAKHKIVVFAGFKGFADEIADLLQHRYGDAEVSRFTHSLGDSEKEESVQHFRHDENRWILVCDETGGEGRNFQFAESLVHIDLPWAVSSIEQRIGRLDRIGRIEDVNSHIVFNSAAIESAWCACLVDGFGVFSQSISGVEFALREQQNRALDAAIEGVDQLFEIVAAIASDSAQERASDEANALLDDASHRGLSTTRFAGPPSGDIDRVVQEGFVAFFRSLSSSGSVRRISDARSILGLWSFKPDEIRNVTVPELKESASGSLAEHVGTFIRSEARVRREVEFFCFGNRLFDALTRVAMSRNIGRTFAITMDATGLPRALLFDVTLYAEPNLDSIKDDLSLVNRARLVVDRRRQNVVLRADTLTVVSDSRYAASISEARIGARPARDLAPQQLAKIAGTLDVEWSSHVRAAIDAAIASAKDAFQSRLAVEIGREERTIADQRRRCVVAEGEASVEVARLDSLRGSLGGWRVHVDTLGFVSTN